MHTEKPIAYAFYGPDGLHLIGTSRAAAWLGVHHATLRATVTSVCAGMAVNTEIERRIRAEFPALLSPARLEVPA